MCNHKLVLTITDKKVMTLASKRLLGKLKDKQLFNKIDWITKEPQLTRLELHISHSTR